MCYLYAASICAAIAIKMVDFIHNDSIGDIWLDSCFEYLGVYSPHKYNRLQKSNSTNENAGIFAFFSNLVQQFSFQIVLLTSIWLKNRIFKIFTWISEHLIMWYVTSPFALMTMCTQGGMDAISLCKTWLMLNQIHRCVIWTCASRDNIEGKSEVLYKGVNMVNIINLLAFK